MSSRKSGVIDKDRGWKRIKRDVRRLGSVKVGLQADGSMHEDAGATVAEVAFWNEFGDADRRTPERPFMRNAFDKNAHTLHRTNGKLLNAIYANRIDPDIALRAIGELHQQQIQAEIIELRSPPNAPMTIEKKGSSNPLIDTAQMKNAVRYAVDS